MKSNIYGKQIWDSDPILKPLRVAFRKVFRKALRGAFRKAFAERLHAVVHHGVGADIAEATCV